MRRNVSANGRLMACAKVSSEPYTDDASPSVRARDLGSLDGEVESTSLYNPRSVGSAQSFGSVRMFHTQF